MITRLGHVRWMMSAPPAPFPTFFALSLAALLLSCGGSAPQPKSRAPITTPRAEGPSPAPPQPVAPSSRAPADADASAASAVAALRSYYDSIEAGRYDDAYALRWTKRPDAAAFAASFARYASYHANLGTPGPLLAAGGSLYVDVPVQISGTLRSGAPFGSAGTVTLRRAAGVDGSTPDQRRWRIYQ